MIFRLDTLLIGLIGLAGLSLQADEKKMDAIVVNDPEWPPYFFAGDKTKPPGLMKEILSQCLAKNNYAFEFKFQPIERMQVGIEQGSVDINLFSFKPERENIVEFGKEVLFTSSYRPFVRSDSKIEIKTIADFDKYRLGHTIGLRYSKDFYNYVQKRKTEHSIDESSREEFNIRKLEAKRIDVFVSTDSTVLYVAKRIGLDEKIKMLDFDIQKADYFIAVSKKSPRIPDRSVFLRQMEDCVRSLRKSGEICTLSQKYNLPCSKN